MKTMYFKESVTGLIRYRCGCVVVGQKETPTEPRWAIVVAQCGPGACELPRIGTLQKIERKEYKEWARPRSDRSRRSNSNVGRRDKDEN